MTDNELAIERLKDIKTKVESIGDSVALDIAISALKGFEGMTNGEVFKAIFTQDGWDVRERESVVFAEKFVDGEVLANHLDTVWWNKPYKKGE